MNELKNELNEIYKKYSLVEDKHIYYDKEGGYTIFTRLAILKIAKAESIKIEHDVYFHNELIVVKASANGESTFGEASPNNNSWPFPVNIAEKRADSRLVIKIILSDYEEKAMGEEEIGISEKPNKGQLIINDLNSKLKVKK